jgi:serine protease inhibitor
MEEKNNLLEETLDYLKDYGIKEDQIRLVQSHETNCSWEEFKELAKDVNYSPTEEFPVIEPDLCLILKNGGWIRRIYFNGKEGWIKEFFPLETHQRDFNINDLLY